MPRIRILILAAALLPACGQPDVLAPEPFDGPAFAAADCALALSDDQAAILIGSLIAQVDALEASGALNAGQANALRTKLESALAAIQAGKYCAARAHLGAFREQVNNFLGEGKLTDQQAFPLTQPVTGALGETIVLPYRVTVDAPSSAAGTYDANYAVFGPIPTPGGVSGALVVVNDGSATPTLGCAPLVGFPAGAIALIDRGTCLFIDKAKHAQDAGAVAVVIMNHNFTGGDAIALGAPSDPVPYDIAIPTVSVSYADGVVLKAGLPATGTVSRKP